MKISAVLTVSLRHEAYALDIVYSNDITLLQLEVPQADAGIAEYRTSFLSTPFNWKFRAIGYGISSKSLNDAESAGTLRGAELTALFYEPSVAYFKLLINEGKGICSGDSGGPAFNSEGSPRILMGIASSVEFRGPKACDFTALYMNVEYYRPWIDHQIELFRQVAN